MIKTNIDIIIVSNIVKSFAENLKREFRELKKILTGIGIDVNKAIPIPFGSEFVQVQAYYSLDRNQYFIVFNQAEIEDEFSFMIVEGNPMPISIFDYKGIEGEATLTQYTLQNEHQKLVVDFSIIFSHLGFLNRLNNIAQYAIEKLNLQ